MSQSVAVIRLADVPSGEGLLHALEAHAEATARVVLLDATGDAAQFPALTQPQFAAILRSQLPTVFAFEGSLRGSAAELALAADIRVCSASASLQGRLGGNARIRSLANEGTALELFLGRTPLAANALLAAGLVSAVTSEGAALAEGARIAETIASRGPIATRLGKEAVWRGLALPLEHALRFETDLTLLLQTTKDRAEGVRAFLEKRTPNFTGE